MKRFVNRLWIAVPAFVLGAIPASASAATINVPANFPTIQAAIDAALPGDTILVAGGVYKEVLNVPMGLTGLVLRGKKGAILDARPAGVDSGAAIVIAANTVTVRDLTIRHAANIVSNNGDGIRVTGTGFVATKVTIQHCENNGITIGGAGAVINTVTISSVGEHGVASTAGTTTVRSVKTNGTGDDGVNVVGATAIVDKCTVREPGGDGVQISGASASVTKCTVLNSDSRGIVITGDTATVNSNTVTNCSDIALDFGGNTITATKNKIRAFLDVGVNLTGNTASITKNTISDGDGTGIIVSGTGNTLTNNNIQRVRDGIDATGLTNNVGDNVVREIVETGILVHALSAGSSAIANDVRNTRLAGIEILSTAVTVAGNSLRDCGAYDVPSINVSSDSSDVTGNTVRNSRSDAIRINGNTNSVAANNCQSGYEDGIDIESGSNNSLSNNTCSSNAGEGIDNSGGNTSIQNCTAKKNRTDIANDGTIAAFNFNVFDTGGQSTLPEIDS